VRLTPEAAAALDARAAPAGTTASGFVRSLIADCLELPADSADRQPSPRPTIPDPTLAALGQLAGQVSKVGGLLAQLFREAEVGRVPSKAEIGEALGDLRRERAALSRLMAEVQNALGRHAR
jgi:uncharacterized protein (DUF2342 family)